ncbi:MAG: GreA/GreB family elongation factor [Calditrichaceae bacterium]
MTVCKKEIKKELLKEIQNRIELYEKSFEDACRRSNESEGRNQSRYDTHKIETGYEADAYARKTMELRQIYQKLKEMSFPDSNDRVRLGSLVRLKWKDGGKEENVLLITQAGGMDLKDLNIMTVSSQAPLSQAIINSQAGEIVEFQMGRKKQMIEIISIN